jgi:hypothetical protein
MKPVDSGGVLRASDADFSRVVASPKKLLARPIALLPLIICLQISGR